MSKQRYVMPHAVAMVHAGMGDVERALEWLEKGYEEHCSLMCFLSTDPAFDALRLHHRFQDLLHRIGPAQSGDWA